MSLGVYLEFGRELWVVGDGDGAGLVGCDEKQDALG